MNGVLLQRGPVLLQQGRCSCNEGRCSCNEDLCSCNEGRCSCNKGRCSCNEGLCSCNKGRGRRSESPGSEACGASASTKAVPSASSIACFSIAAPRDCLSVEPGWGGVGERSGSTSAWAGARNRRSNSSRSISTSACIPKTLIEYSSATDCARPSEPLSQRNLSSPLTREIVSPEAKKRQLSPQNYVGDVKLLGSTSLRRL